MPRFSRLCAGLFLVIAVLVGAWQHQPASASPSLPYKAVCGHAAPGYASCFAEVVKGPVHPLAGNAVPYGPAPLHSAYNLPCTPGGPVRAVCSAPASFGGQTIAIVDANGDPTIQSDLNTYDAKYGLPACTTSNGCLSIVNQRGQSSPLPSPNGWEIEIALDVETAHGICQTCKVLLVEADDASFGNLAASEDMAASLGATEISNSYGGPEFSGESALEGSYTHPGIAVVASSGDNGYGTIAPAALPEVLAAGGTSLFVNADGSYNRESAWSGAGSGCSTQFSAQSWQVSASSLVGCSGARAVADISAVADPNTGVAVVSGGAWQQVGGTSLSSPLLASVIALAGGVAGIGNAGSVPYGHISGFRDVTSGSNGSCGGRAICQSRVGFDGPTGLGSPNGTAGFGGMAPVPTPTPTSIAPEPTSTVPVPTSTVVPPTPTSTPVPPTPRPTATKTPVHHKDHYCAKWSKGGKHGKGRKCLWWKRKT